MKHEVIKKLEKDDGCAGNSKLIDINIEKGVNERQMDHGEQVSNTGTVKLWNNSKCHGITVLVGKIYEA